MDKKSESVDGLMSELTGSGIGRLNKGLGHLEQPMDAVDIPGLGWNLLNEDLSLPSAVLHEKNLRHNLRWMQEFIQAYGVKLAPHGKTTMAPKLFAMQLEAGAWGITLATAHQTLVAYEHGVRRVLMMNQLVGKENMAIVARLLRDAQFEYFCLVDSAELVERLGAYFSARGLRLQVLLELGVKGGRTGVRDAQGLEAALTALARWKEHIVLSGIEIFEGVLHNEAEIRGLLDRAVATMQELVKEGKFARKPAILTGAGSAWYDVVAEVFTHAGLGDAVEIILRPGCYLTHDAGIYREAQALIEKRNPITHKWRTGLLPALQVWAYVQSVPEEGLAIVGMGKRDASFDAGLPIPVLHFRPGNREPVLARGNWKVTRMMDQHAFLEIADGDDLRVGDMIGFDISHPCLTFDRWPYVLVVNANYKVVDVVETFF